MNNPLSFSIVAQFPIAVGTIAALAPSQGWTSVEAAAALLGANADTDAIRLGEQLIKRGYTLSREQMEEVIIALAERGAPDGMHADGFGNFFFVRTGDPKNPVALFRVSRSPRSSTWHIRVDHFASGQRWNERPRVLVYNFESMRPLAA